ncbi:MAG: hypothetical protein Q7J84_06655 [Sulfuricaulis sp.]|nr:hypothetical protein [Sulfuricaulis sp.]
MVFSIITYPIKGAGFPRVCLFILGQGFDADKVNLNKKIYRAVKSVFLPNSQRPVDSRYGSQNARHRSGEWPGLRDLAPKHPSHYGGENHRATGKRPDLGDRPIGRQVRGVLKDRRATAVPVDRD